MKLHLLKAGIDAFIRLVSDPGNSGHLYKYELLSHVADMWDLGADDLSVMYDNVLQSDITTRWWNRTAYNPKEVMLLFIRMEPDYIRQAFRDLLDEKLSIDRRIDRFQFYCDELLRVYKSRNKNSIINHHYQDAGMLSLYLAGIYPQQYTLFPGEAVFRDYLRNVGSPADDLSLLRFFKVARIVMKFLREHDGFDAMVARAKRPADNLLISHECIIHIGGHWDVVAP